MNTYFHGSYRGDLTEIAANQCITRDIHLATAVASGKLGSSESRDSNVGWVYELQLAPEQVKKDDIDFRLTEAVQPVRVISTRDIPPDTRAHGLR